MIIDLYLIDNRLGFEFVQFSFVTNNSNEKEKFIHQFYIEYMKKKQLEDDH